MSPSTDLLLTLAIFVAGILALPLLTRSWSHRRPLIKTGNVRALRKRLKTMAGGDERVVERLLKREREKNPTGTEEDHLRRVLDSWISDRSR